MLQEQGRHDAQQDDILRERGNLLKVKTARDVHKSLNNAAMAMLCNGKVWGQ